MYIVKVICFVFILLGICQTLISFFPIRHRKTRKTFALLMFIPMGIISVVSYAQSLSGQSDHNVAIVTLCSGIAAVFLAVSLSSRFGKNVLSNVIGNFIYDILKFTTNVLIGIPSFIRNIFRRWYLPKSDLIVFHFYEGHLVSILSCVILYTIYIIWIPYIVIRN
jgi:hypothetical protein